MPGTNIRFGVDALIGLVPGIGDAITTLMSLYIVREARALGAPRHLVARMLVNVALDGVVGACRCSATPSTRRGGLTAATWRCCRSHLAARGAAMTAPLVVSIPHRLGKHEAVRRLKNGLGQARTSFGHLMSVDEEVWNGDRLTFRLRALGQAARHDRRDRGSSAA